MDRSKGSRIKRRSENLKKYMSRRRKRPLNRHEMVEKQTTSASAKKIKASKEIPHIREDNDIDYRILNFVTVFRTLSEYVKCKICAGNVTFQTASTRGLGFKILINCELCGETASIPSCPYIGSTYEVNRRFTFTMRLLGIGLEGCKKFCGVMDLPPPVTQATYDLHVENIRQASLVVCEASCQRGVEEEKEALLQKDVEDPSKLTVSGDGTWKKRGHSSLYGVSSIIGWETGKVVDVLVKSSYCKTCETWKRKKNGVEYEEWKAEHESTCLANHQGSAGKMEVDSIKEMFQRSIQKYGVIYRNYIGDGDSQTYKGIVAANPYGENEPVNKKECIGHIQKRMGTRLRKLKKAVKGLSGRNKLTGNLIDKLTIYYGLAIRRHCNESVEAMKKAIWATFYHYSSTDENPQHDYCPEGEESWCTYQQAKLRNELHNYRHKQPLHEDVLKAIKPIYEDLSKENLLERCLGGFTQNNNESLNQIIWKITPKELPGGAKIVDIAANVAASLFNDGATAILHILHTLGIRCGRNVHRFGTESNLNRIRAAERKTVNATREARLRRRLERSELYELLISAEKSYYGPE